MFFFCTDCICTPLYGCGVQKHSYNGVQIHPYSGVQIPPYNGVQMLGL